MHAWRLAGSLLITLNLTMPRVQKAATSLFPLMLRIEGKDCLVVGGGKIAAEKIAGLLAHGAKVTVVSPRAVSSIQTKSRRGILQWKKRRFSPNDLSSALLVIAATNSSVVNSSVFRACKQRGILCNAVDDPKNCDFFYPAVVRRGPLQIAISTGGNSPALAARLRRELEKQFGPKWCEWVEHLGEARRELMQQKISMPTRRAKLLSLASEKAFRGYLLSSRPHKSPHR